MRYFYKRVRDDATIYQGSMFPLDDPELIEITEEDYFSELQSAEPTEGDVIPVEPEPDDGYSGDAEDEATVRDYEQALADLGVRLE